MTQPSPKSNPRGIQRIAFALPLAIGAAAALLIVALHLLEPVTHLDFLAVVEQKLIDLRFRIRGPRAPSDQVAIVAIDSKSVEAIGRWPWSRTTHAEFIDRLREAKVSAVAFDVLFTEEEGATEAARLNRVAAELPAGAVGDAARAAVSTALSEVQVDRVFAAAIERTYDDDKALVVLAFDFVFPDDLSHAGHLGKVLTDDDEQIILDIGSFASRDSNLPLLRDHPPQLALGIRPVITRLAEGAAGLGFANPVLDADGSLRRDRAAVVYSPEVRKAVSAGQDPLIALADPSSRVQAFQSLAEAAVATHYRLQAGELELDLANGELRFPPGPDGKPRRHRFDPTSATIGIDYHGASGTIPTWSYIDVLRGTLTRQDGTAISNHDALAGRLLFVGATDPGLGDFFPTPFTARLPGVEKHANVAENLITGRGLHHHRDAETVVIISAVLAAIAGALLTTYLGAVAAGGAALAVAAGFATFTYRDFASHGQVWNWTIPLLTLLLSYLGAAGYRQVVEARGRREMEARSEFIQNTFGRYLSEEVVKMLVDTPEGLRLGGEKRRLTILMSDLRGFTSLCERCSPEIVIEMLNFYLGTMADIVLEHGGTVDEFIGDAILALFGAPVAREDDARRAVACAIAMHLAMPSVNQKFRERGLPEVEMGIAVNTGDVVVGNIGSERRSKYGVVGSAVNLTSRIESYTVGGQALISGITRDEAGADVEVGEKIEVKAKGLKDPVPAFDLRGIGGEYARRMPEVKESLVDIAEPIAASYAVLEGKHIGASKSGAAFKRLSRIGGDLQIDTKLAPLTNLKLKLKDPAGEDIEGDLYAKVIDREAAPGCIALRFTSVPPAVKKALTDAIDAAG